MVQPASGRSRPAMVLRSHAVQPRPAVQRRVMPQQTLASAVAPLRSAHGFIFNPVMRVAGTVMDWRLQRDGFVARDIKVSGGHVRLWDARGQGKGPCVVFMHGLGGSSAEYRDTLVWLKTKCRRVIAVDLPSHGGSSAMGRETARGKHVRRRVIDKMQARINRALDAVLNERANVVGHSLGGYAAMRYALEGRHRGLVHGIGLVSPDGAPWTAQELADDGVMFDVDGYTQAGDIATRTYPTQPFKAAMVTPFLYARFATPEMQYLNHSDAKQPVLSPSQLGALPRRVWLVFGKQERFDPPHNLAYFLRHLPPGTVLRRPNTGHGDIVDAHPDVLRALEDLLV